VPSSLYLDKCKGLWRNHGLSITFLVIGFACYLSGLWLHFVGPPSAEPGKVEWLRTSDFLYNIGHGFFPLAVYNFLAGHLREVNKPEDPA
jgi:hypothetical protein